MSHHWLQVTLPGLFSFSKGELTITSEMEELANALFYDSVPESWTRYAYPSLLSLASWYADLLLRIRVSRACVTVRAWGASRYPRDQDSPHQCPGLLVSGLFLSIDLTSLKYLKRAVTPGMGAQV